MSEWPVDWEVRTLGDAATWYSGGTPRTSAEEYWNGSIPWITSGSLTKFRLSTSVRTLTEDGLQSGSRLVPAGTTLLVVRGMSLKNEVRIGIATRPVAFGQDCKALVPVDGIDSEFFAYAVLARHAELLGLVDEAGHGTGRLNTDQVKDVRIGLPSEAEQRSIASVLAALDDKRESTLRVVEKVTATVAAMFRALAERTTSTVALPSLAEFHKGVSYRSEDLQPSRSAMVTLKSFGRHGGYVTDGLKPFVGGYNSDQVIAPGEMAVAQTDLTQAADVVGRVVRVPQSSRYDTLIASLDVVICRPRPQVPTAFLFGVLSDERFRAHCRAHTSGTTVLHLAKDAFPNYQAADVDRDAQELFHQQADPLLEAQHAAAAESETLAALRDALLPELLSGRLRVPEAEELVSEVT